MFKRTVRLQIKDIIRLKRYEGVERLYGLDIALLVLSESLDINDNIMPACVDWTASMKLQPNETGVVSINKVDHIQAIVRQLI